jgi:AcrR family transcriptional regulator
VRPPEPGLRERKKAAQRNAIVAVFLEALETSELGDLKIDELCARIGISKVTFFNYFSSKEQVLEYFVLTWQFRTAAALEKSRLTGSAALHLVLDSIALHPAALHVMNAVMLYFLKTRDPQPMVLSDYEYYLVDSDAWERGVRPVGIDGLFAMALGSRLDDPNTAANVRLLIAGLYGVPLRLRITGDSDLKSAYREFVALIAGRFETQQPVALTNR